MRAGCRVCSFPLLLILSVLVFTCACKVFDIVAVKESKSILEWGRPY